MRFTDEQTEAIERRGGSLFLHAGAGSGKTRVLVERFVRAVCDDDVAVDRILAITFTEKAAAELKTRIRRRFLDLDERERAREAEGAWVSTIHGFCARLLRTHPLTAGIDPEFRVLDDPGASRLAVDAFDSALESFLRNATRGERIDLVASYTPDKLQGMVRTVYSRLRSQGQRAPRLPGIAPPQPGDERARLERAVRAAQSALAGVDVNASVTKSLTALEGCSSALAKLPEGELGDAADFKELAVKRGNAKALQGDVFDELDEAHAEWMAACSAKKAYADYVLLAKLLELYDRAYVRLKDDRSSLDFEDLELRGRDLLKRDPALRNGLRARFAQVMVDEYQDTNPLQNELIDLLSNDNLFTVGDEFQSIYGFRNADVGVFRARRDAAAAADATARLATNFRSAPELLDMLNAAFEEVWGEGYTPLAPAPDAPRDEPGAEPRVELLLVDKHKGRWEEALGEDAFGEGSEVTPWRMAEARLMASRVEELVSSGRFAAGDVAVLLRSARDMPAYERALSDRGLPTYAHGGGGYWDQQQIGDLRAYLAALANPQDEAAIYSVLASPIVGVSLDTLVLVKRHARKGNVWWGLEDAFLPEGEDPDGLAEALPERDRERVAAFVERFVAERRAAPRLSLETLIDRAVTGSGYDRAILALAHGERRLANVRKLMRLAREYERDNGRDLRGFIDYVDERQLLATREGEAPLAGEGLAAVRLMTVHAAKGLEFPLVCVADLGRAARDDYGPLQVSREGEIGLEVASLGGGKTKTREMDKIKEQRNAEAEEEERRIFYVAMTRAERHLIVSGATDTVKWPEPKPLGPPMDWVLPALAPGARVMWERETKGVDERGVRCVKLTPEVVDEVLPAGDRAPVPKAVDVESPEVERPSFARVAGGVSLPVARLSYSAVESYKRCGYRFYVERVVGMRRAEALEAAVAPAENGSDDGQLALGEAAPVEASIALSPMSRGTVVHELLEDIDFSRPAAPSDDAVAERIRAHGATADDAAVADALGLIDGFLASDLCARLGGARRVRLELPFAFGLEPPGLGGQSLLINGVVDVHAEEVDRTLVVDYKTDALQGRDPAAACEEKYATQRVVYALAALRSGAEQVEVIYVFLERPDAPVATTFTAADAPRLESQLLELAAGILGREFAPAAEPHRELCHLCPAQPALCSWDLKATTADRPEGETIGGAEPVDVAEGLVG